ncbi:GNAT family N-acetyltransferase [Piscinibacter koreensis]|uniref:GNAT family N-acetyltransferase n=1 Tax=Piscinibacter koreensis TaxID=2742824 RepID=A0A7Y6NLB5_9BURK|nr:GNAT family N-acetyltransferase [Schlegelella koreensis]NUZ05186.1 GNAT family N-acetyltransferase [Schlegelella koreensis]
MLSKLRALFGELGVGAGSVYLLDRVLRKISHRCGVYLYELVVQPIGDKPLLPPRLSKNIRFHEIAEHDADMQRLLARPEIKVSRFAQGAVCLGVYRLDVLIGHVWFCFGRYEEDEVRCDFRLPAPGDAWDFDLYVFPEHRMGIGFMAVWDAAFAYLRERGVARSFSRVNRFNLASRRAHARLGSRPVGSALFVKLGHTELTLSSAAPFVGLTRRRRLALQVPNPGPAAAA